ncbi:MAG: cation-translocating P-type ATPase [Patescibacteria group bacterium]
MKRLIFPPRREWIIISAVSLALVADFFVFDTHAVLFAVAIIGAFPTIFAGLRSLVQKKISIDTFNSFALGITFVTWEIRSAAFINLMLAFARLLDWYTESRTSAAVEELLALKPSEALLERDHVQTVVPADTVRPGDILIVKPGARVPVDGVVVFGKASLNESAVTGESALVEKVIGEEVFSTTLNESGMLKIKATHVGKDSIIERMAVLVEKAQQNKSHTQKIADRFAQIFLPVVGIVGVLTFVITHNVSMVVALFLVACADDIAVSIPLAMTAALGRAAKRGVIIKGGQSLDMLGRVRTLVLDKTGTLTYGKLAVSDIHIEGWVDHAIFWKLVASAEKYSEHPMGKALYHEAAKKNTDVVDPEEFKVFAGDGVWGRLHGHEIAIGDEGIAERLGLTLDDETAVKMKNERDEHLEAAVYVFVDKKFAGIISIGDTPRIEAARTIAHLRKAGVERIVILTGDNPHVAQRVASTLGITDVRASMTPESKYRALEELSKLGPLAMVGDGINDAPALARADVGIAMGGGGTAVAVETADVVILTDDLERIPEMIELGRQTRSVIKGDIVTWCVSNAVGFALVFTGVLGPILAAVYNFATDFLPILNSARLFGWMRKNRQMS